MNLLLRIVGQNHQLLYQCLIVPPALLFYSLARQGLLGVVHRYIYLTLGGSILAVLTMGPYSLLLFVSVGVFILLVYSVEPRRIHQWTFTSQMFWQSLWHFYIQYQQHWLQEPTDSRLMLAASSLMLLTQRITSVSMDLREGKVIGPSKRSRKDQPYFLISLLSYTFYFPALLGGPLCSFNRFVAFVEQINVSPPPSPLFIVSLKVLHMLLLVWIKYVLISFIQSSPISWVNLWDLHGILWIWILSLAFKISYYSHWMISECVNNAVGLGFRGYSPNGSLLWDGLTDGDPCSIELSCRPSVFARRWNKTTAEWLRRLIFNRCSRAPVLMTFLFSAWWHGLHPGQVVGFLAWAVAVAGDYRLHNFLRSKLSSVWRKVLYSCLGWVQTQMIIACVVVVVELRSFLFVKLLCTSYMVVFPLINIIIILY
ncbi:membrane-bound ghrelin O-acyltransferase mboat4 [Chanos chanos]|uniref:Membrane-bound ghrelin O-acyltransferase mboat4 n=1 Tax=Chanos chanos TaxID=29144 RepID=A0A6J2WTX5_CHACN|nr:ghrelin O-acyltransferase [Chanos chanos]